LAVVVTTCLEGKVRRRWPVFGDLRRWNGVDPPSPGYGAASMEARAGGAVRRAALEWSGPAFAKLRRGEGWNRLELAKSRPSPADVSLEAAFGDSSAVEVGGFFRSDWSAALCACWHYTFSVIFLGMSKGSGKFYIPPFACVRLLECRDHITLTPVPSFREFFAYGKVKATEAVIELEDGTTEPFWDNCSPDEEVWAVVQWVRFEDGHEEKGSIKYLRSPHTEEDARQAMEEMSDFYSMSRKDMVDLGRVVETSEADEAFIDRGWPNYQSPPSDPKAIDEYDVYQARLKVLAGLHPKTVELIKLADGTQDPQKRQKIERETVQAYFAELAHYWTEDEVLAWQKSNPIGTEWMREFARVFEEPKREIDPIKHELAFNWLRRKYNLLTAEELSDKILLATLQRLTPEAIKKRRERLGLTTKRKPGSPEK